MDKLLTAIERCDYDDKKDVGNLKTLLVKSQDVFLKNLPALDDALSILSPKEHTLGWIFILAIKTITAIPDPARFVSQVRTVINSGTTKQVRHVPAKFVQVCKKFLEIHMEANQPMGAIRDLHTAITKLRPNSESVTPLHADFLQACLGAKNYKAALPVLSEEVYELASPDDYKLTPKDLLRYFYYAGNICVGMKQFDRALEYYKLGITAPAMVLSAVMIECYKKYVLVSLITHGQLQSIPKYTSSVVQRNLKATCPQYTEFVNAYSTNSTDEVHKVAAQHAEAFTKDNNFGLLKQCIKALYRKNIKRHTQTYLTLSLSDIADTVKLKSPKDAEREVLRMVEDAQIFATINQKDGMVSFGDNPEQYNGTKMMAKLDTQIREAIDLACKLKVQDQAIAASSEYIQKTMNERGGRWGGGGGADLEEYEMQGGRGPPGFRGKGGRKGKGKK